MQVLVIGGGGREHTLVWKLAQSKSVTKIYAAPGNPGMKGLAECVDLDIADLDGLADWAEKHAIDLTVVGPEAPLVAGIVQSPGTDHFRTQCQSGGNRRLQDLLQGADGEIRSTHGLLQSVRQFG